MHPCPRVVPAVASLRLPYAASVCDSPDDELQGTKLCRSPCAHVHRPPGAKVDAQRVFPEGSNPPRKVPPVQCASTITVCRGHKAHLQRWEIEGLLNIHFAFSHLSIDVIGIVSPLELCRFCCWDGDFLHFCNGRSLLCDGYPLHLPSPCVLRITVLPSHSADSERPPQQKASASARVAKHPRQAPRNSHEAHDCLTLAGLDVRGFHVSAEREVSSEKSAEHLLNRLSTQSSSFSCMSAAAKIGTFPTAGYQDLKVMP